jgi:hypothetical protein
MLGPKQQLLASYITSADDTSLDGASTQWKTGEGLLRRLATELDTKAQNIGKDERFSGESARAASEAFTKSAKKMNDRADEMRDGAGAFTAAAHAVRQAKKASSGFSQHSGERPPQQPPDLNDVKAQRDWKTQNNTFWHSYNSRESDAADAITALQDNHRTQAAVFAKIHGETPPPPPGGGGGTHNPVRPGTPYVPTHVPTHPVGTEHVTDPSSHGSHDTPAGGVDHPPVVDPPPWDPPTHPQLPPGTPGIPQGPHPTTPLPGGTFPGGGTLPGTGPGAIGGGPSAVGGVGAVAGGGLGGAAAAGLAGSLGGGLNGLVPMGGAGGIRGGLSASGVRGIGATSRVGAGSVLGRGGTATGRPGAGGMSTRGGGRSGSRSAGTRGSRGRSGARGAGVGAGSGRGGKDKERHGEERDLFDDGSDWIDDEDAAPGVLD